MPAQGYAPIVRLVFVLQLYCDDMLPLQATKKQEEAEQVC